MYKKIFVPVDNSEHSMSSIDIAVQLAKRFDADLVGSHAYAARMHDYRFKQMEFTLPEEYLVEKEMEKQRRVHDTLITMGLELISDSYLVVMEEAAKEHNIPFLPKMYDGKNYRIIADDINESDYDLVVLGALGLGAVRDSTIGSVCERVTRRIKTDALVVKNTAPIEDQIAKNGNGEVGHVAGGNIVVGIDGSPESFAGLRTAISLGRSLGKEVEAISVYDPYLHYAMFNSIVHVLTERAAKVFKFKEQEQLHEEVIDTGLAKIYQSHLEVARSIAKEEDFDLKTTLLDGKAFEKILQYVRREQPWLLVLGRIGVHSEEDMDIGSNTENLLRMVQCNVLLSSQRYTPPVDVQAAESITWTEPAEKILDRAPDFARGIARTTIHRWALERGHSVITTDIVEGAMSTLMPPSAMQRMGIIAENVALDEVQALEDGVTYVCRDCGYAARDFKPAVCAVCGSPPESFEKIDKEALEKIVPLEGDVTEEETFDKVKLRWTDEARKLIYSVPDGYQRRRAKAQIEKKARTRKIPTITLEMVEDVVRETVKDSAVLEERGVLNKTAVDAADTDQAAANDQLVKDGKYSWAPDAAMRIQRVPEGFMRNATKKRVEKAADARGTDVITLEVTEEGIEEGKRMMEEMIKQQGEKSDPGEKK
jgi:nucleotide-binding universal stress UspA family protein